MKAITVTLNIKNLNPDLFSNNSIGQIKTFTSIPKVFYRPSGGGRRTDAYDTLSALVHQADGFYSVIIPAYDTSIQYLGPIYFTGDNFTYPVINYTSEELVTQDNINAFNSASTLETTRSNEGVAEVKFIYKRLRKLYNSGALTLNQFQQAQDLLFDALLPCTYGLWEISYNRLNAIPNPANATLLAVLTEIRTRINYYISNDSRQEEII